MVKVHRNIVIGRIIAYKDVHVFIPESVIKYM
jgi:hypothetical protein